MECFIQVLSGKYPAYLVTWQSFTPSKSKCILIGGEPKAELIVEKLERILIGGEPITKLIGVARSMRSKQPTSTNRRNRQKNVKARSSTLNKPRSLSGTVKLM